MQSAASTSPREPGAEDPWRAWIRQVGVQLRRAREFVGLSQEQLGRLAGVSQGAVSRLEVGRGLQTPLVVVVKIHLALSRALRELEPALVSDELRRLIDSERLISPPVNSAGSRIPSIGMDPALDELVRIYRDMPPSRRETFAGVIRAAAEALAKVP